MGLQLQGSKNAQTQNEPLELINQLVEICCKELSLKNQRKISTDAIDKLFNDKDVLKKCFDVPKSCHLIAEKLSAIALAHQKHLKKFFKNLIGNLIDLYPNRSYLLQHLVDCLSLFIECKNRLVRLNFIHIGVQVFKVLLEQRAQFMNFIDRMNLTTQTS